MKKYPFLLVIAIALSALGGLYAQCLTDGITFTSQAQIDGFSTAYPSCTEIGGDVEITGAGINSLAGLAGVTAVGGDLLIHTNFILTGLEGLEALETVGGSLMLWSNDALISMSGLNALTTIGGDFAIGANLNTCFCPLGNAALASLEGLEQLSSIGGGLYILKNPVLTTFSGLNNLIAVGGDLSIADNTTLVSLTGLEGLQSVWGHVSVGVPSLELPHGNPALASLDGLENLTLIGESLSIIHNQSLTDITALHHAISIGPGLTITENAQLSECAAQAVCDYLTIPAAPTDISDNGPGCTSREEVEEACQAVSVDDWAFGDAIQLFPNPTSGIIQIEAPDNAEWEVSLREAMGRMIIQPRQMINGEIDLSSVPAGLYFLEMNDGQRSVAKLIIKQ